MSEELEPIEEMLSVWSAPPKHDRWLMDGSLHERGDRCCRSRQRCSCGGVVHMQPLYGSIDYLCEDCGSRERPVQ